jgi:hypothetical protein
MLELQAIGLSFPLPWHESPSARGNHRPRASRLQAMIFPDPTNDVLCAADLIALFDPGVPGWHEVVTSLLKGERHSSTDFLVVDIPVDSTDEPAVRAWKDRITTVRSG